MESNLFTATRMMMPFWILFFILIFNFVNVQSQTGDQPELISTLDGGPKNVAFQRPIMTSVGGTCGEDSPSQAVLPTTDSAGTVSWSNQHCTTTCDRMHIQNFQPTELLGDEQIVFGDVDCRGNDTYVEILVLFPCYVNISRKIMTEETYSLWLYLEGNRSESKTVMQTAQFHITMDKSNLIIGNNKIPYRSHEWFHLAIIVQNDNVVYFVDGEYKLTDSAKSVSGMSNQRVLVGTCDTCEWQTPVGFLKKFSIYDVVLTYREIAWLNSTHLPMVHPVTDCLCPQSQPSYSTTYGNMDLTCDPIMGGDTVPRLQNENMDQRFYLVDFLVDGDRGVFYNDDEEYPIYWASQPNVADVVITIDLLDLVDVSEITFHGMNGIHPGGMLLRRMYKSAWMDWYYLAEDCSPFSGESVGCSTVSIGKQLTQPSTFLWNVSSTYIDQERRLADDISVTFLGSSTDANVFTEIEVTASYVPYLNSSDPSIGPYRGGTNITMTGGNLEYYDFDITLENTLVRPMTCEIVYKDMNMIICATPKLDTNSISQDITKLSMEINVKSSSDDPMDTPWTFDYSPDPVVTSITSMETIVSGGIQQIVTGSNFDSVAYPMFQIKMNFMGQDVEVFEKQCHQGTSTTLWCDTPEITLPSQMTKINRGLLNNNELVFEGGIFLDGVIDYNTINVYTDPIIIHFEGVVKVHYDWKTNIVELKGRDLTDVDQEFYEIMIGKEICPITKFMKEKIKCEAPNNKQPEVKLWEDNWQEAPPLVVKIGSTLRYKPGYLFYHHSVWDDNSYRVGIMCGVATIVMIVFVIILTYMANKVKKKEKKNEKSGMYRWEHELENGKGSQHGHKIYNLLDEDTQDLIKPCKIRRKQLELGLELHKGNIGSLYDGHLIAIGRKAPVNLKVLKETGLGMDRSGFLDRASVFLHDTLQFFRETHPNIHKPIGVATQAMTISVVYPPILHNSLWDYMKDSSQTLTISNLTKLAKDIAQGMAQLESRNIPHGDLAARNCVVNLKGTAQVSDAGLSQDFYPHEYHVPQGSSKPIAVRWAAPELFQGCQPDSQSDVWSYGVLLWEIFTRGAQPYAHLKLTEVMDDVLQGEMLAKPQGCPEAIYQLMQNCWNPSSRPLFSVIVGLLGETLEDMRVAGTDGSINAAYVEDEKPPGYNTALRLQRERRAGSHSHSPYRAGRMSLYDESTAL